MKDVQRFADVTRGMMKARLDGDLGVVNEGGIQRYMGSRRAAAEQVDRPAAPNHSHGLLPGFRSAHRLDYDVGAAPSIRDSAHLLHNVQMSRIENVIRPHPLAHDQLLFSFSDGDHGCAQLFQHPHKHEADRTHTDYHYCVAFGYGRLLYCPENAGQRLHERRLAKAEVVRQDEKVLTDDSFGDLYVLGVGAVEELKVLAQIRQVSFAEKALVARAGVGRTRCPT